MGWSIFLVKGCGPFFIARTTLFYSLSRSISINHTQTENNLPFGEMSGGGGDTLLEYSKLEEELQFLSECPTLLYDFAILNKTLSVEISSKKFCVLITLRDPEDSYMTLKLCVLNDTKQLVITENGIPSQRIRWFIEKFRKWKTEVDHKRQEDETYNHLIKARLLLLSDMKLDVIPFPFNVSKWKVRISRDQTGNLCVSAQAPFQNPLLVAVDVPKSISLIKPRGVAKFSALESSQAGSKELYEFLLTFTAETEREVIEKACAKATLAREAMKDVE